jgi:hypothetical protein
MNANTGSIPRAIVGRGWDIEWFDTMPGERMALRVHSREVGGAFTIVEARVAPLSGPPVHLHRDREEIFEVLNGEFRFRCAGEEFDKLRHRLRVIKTDCDQRVPSGPHRAFVGEIHDEAKKCKGACDGADDDMLNHRRARFK